jgi:hypothetical protein
MDGPFASCSSLEESNKDLQKLPILKRIRLSECEMATRFHSVVKMLTVLEVVFQVRFFNLLYTRWSLRALPHVYGNGVCKNIPVYKKHIADNASNEMESDRHNCYRRRHQNGSWSRRTMDEDFLFEPIKKRTTPFYFTSID